MARARTRAGRLCACAVIGLLVVAGVVAADVAVDGERDGGMTQEGQVDARAAVDDESHPGRATDAGPAVSAAAGSAWPEGLQLPVYFVENQGRFDAEVSYHVTTSRMNAWFTPTGITYALQRPPTPAAEGDGTARRWAVKLGFLDARAIAPHGQAMSPTKVSYFRGPPRAWDVGLSTFDQVVYEDLWPGIDMVYSGTSGGLTYSFVVHPGADPSQIRLTYRGAPRVFVDSAGRLTVRTPVGTLVDSAPLSYQGSGSARRPVFSSWTRRGTTPDTGVFGFRFGHYDISRPLVIDHAAIAHAGYVGGSGIDDAGDIAVDERGAAYLTGITTSTAASFPDKVGPDRTFNDNADAFVAKVRPDGTGLVYAGYIGGAGLDEGRSVAIDGTGAAYVAGETASSAATFPVSRGPDLTYGGGFADGFVAKINARGTALDYAGYIGGDQWEYDQSIAVDADGEAYVVGGTESTEATLPVTMGPDLTFNSVVASWRDGYIAKVNAQGSGFAYLGYIGGHSEDRATGVAVSPDGAAYVVGVTQSDEASFPVAVGPDLTFAGDLTDGFVTRVRPDGVALRYAGYIGGSGLDSAVDVDVDAVGAAYVTGETDSSPREDFPVTVGPGLTYHGRFGVDDPFVAKVAAAGTGFAYAGYLGADIVDRGLGIAVTPGGEAYVVTDATLNHYIGRVGADPRNFEYPWGPMITGSKTSIAVDAVRDVYVAGSADSWFRDADRTRATRVGR